MESEIITPEVMPKAALTIIEQADKFVAWIKVQAKGV